MKKLLLGCLISVSLLSGCNKINLNDVKENARNVWGSNGFSVTGYQGYQYGLFGAYVWYTVEKNGITYEGCIQKYDGEYHIYNLKALDAISNK